MELKALILNCSLKKSPEKSNTDALSQIVTDELKALDVATETLRIADYNIPPGVTSKESEEDDWPKILDKIKAADIFIIASPIWIGQMSSLAQRVCERLDAIFWEEELWDKNTGQYMPYGKVGGAIITGNEDGAQHASAQIFHALMDFGFSIPANPYSYWVGEAGPGPSYIDEGGNEYSHKVALYMAHNLAHLARVLKDNPYPTNLNELVERAKTAHPEKE